MELCSTNSIQILLWSKRRAKQGVVVTCLRSPSKSKAKAPYRKGGNGTSFFFTFPLEHEDTQGLVAGLAAAESWVLMHTDTLMHCRGTQKGLGLHFKLLLVF